jgi:hypothetical protein
MYWMTEYTIPFYNFMTPHTTSVLKSSIKPLRILVFFPITTLELMAWCYFKIDATLQYLVISKNLQWFLLLPKWHWKAFRATALRHWSLFQNLFLLEQPVFCKKIAKWVVVVHFTFYIFDLDMKFCTTPNNSTLLRKC